MPLFCHHCSSPPRHRLEMEQIGGTYLDEEVCRRTPCVTVQSHISAMQMSEKVCYAAVHCRSAILSKWLVKTKCGPFSGNKAPACQLASERVATLFKHHSKLFQFPNSLPSVLNFFHLWAYIFSIFADIWKRSCFVPLNVFRGNNRCSMIILCHYYENYRISILPQLFSVL